MPRNRPTLSFRSLSLIGGSQAKKTILLPLCNPMPLRGNPTGRLHQCASALRRHPSSSALVVLEEALQKPTLANRQGTQQLFPKTTNPPCKFFARGMFFAKLYLQELFSKTVTLLTCQGSTRQETTMRHKSRRSDLLLSAINRFLHVPYSLLPLPKLIKYVT